MTTEAELDFLRTAATCLDKDGFFYLEDIEVGHLLNEMEKTGFRAVWGATCSVRTNYSKQSHLVQHILCRAEP